jgi:hypothetical protein
LKINGETIQGPNIETIYIPRGDKMIVLKAEAVLSYDDFDKLCPTPKPPVKLMKGGKKIIDVEDPGYKAAMDEWASNRSRWMFIKSLSATEGLEFDTIKLSDPSTWTNFEKELTEAGFSDVEQRRIVNGVMTANCLNEAKLEEARDAFLLSQQEPQDQSSSPADELQITPSGELAKDSE